MAIAVHEPLTTWVGRAASLGRFKMHPSALTEAAGRCPSKGWAAGGSGGGGRHHHPAAYLAAAGFGIKDHALQVTTRLLVACRGAQGKQDGGGRVSE